jgi:hypothetical protein
MFRRIKPQIVESIVESSEGYRVQTKDRFHIEYLDELNHAVVEVEFAPAATIIYKSTICIFSRSTGEPNMSSSRDEIIFKRIVAGSEALRDGGSVIVE